MFIPDPNFSIPDPVSKIFRIRIKELSIFNPKIVSTLSEIWSGMFVPDPGVKKLPDPGSRIRICNTAKDERKCYWCPLQCCGSGPQVDRTKHWPSGVLKLWYVTLFAPFVCYSRFLVRVTDEEEQRVHPFNVHIPARIKNTNTNNYFHHFHHFHTKYQDLCINVVFKREIAEKKCVFAVLKLMSSLWGESFLIMPRNKYLSSNRLPMYIMLPVILF
jgi:hypothetical protein